MSSAHGQRTVIEDDVARIRAVGHRALGVGGHGAEKPAEVLDTLGHDGARRMAVDVFRSRLAGVGDQTAVVAAVHRCVVGKGHRRGDAVEFGAVVVDRHAADIGIRSRRGDRSGQFQLLDHGSGTQRMEQAGIGARSGYAQGDGMAVAVEGP